MGNKIIEGLASLTTSNAEIKDDILIMQFTVVNAFLVGKKNSDEWVLIDTGLENSIDHIIKSCYERFKENSKPSAIILTHGHFDHVGSLIKLVELWEDVPIYIHELELPYVTGKKNYPKADSSVDSGIVAKMAPTFPHTSIDIGSRAKPLPMDGKIPKMKGWKWIHTPGHTEGHISLFREKGHILIAGDALCTVKQESLLSVITQNKEINGPPKYLTTDWVKAEESVKKLDNLKPQIIIPSHGKPLMGEEASKYLELLSNNFKDIAVPAQGKFVD